MHERLLCVGIPLLPWGGWRDSPGLAGGGLLADAGVHRLYLALHLFGPVREVHAILDVPGAQGETFAVVILEFSSGARGIIEANHHGPPGTFDDEIEITGSDATLSTAPRWFCATGTPPAGPRDRDRARRSARRLAAW